MPTARFFFDAGSGGVLWAVTPEDKESWGYPVELDRLPISHDLQDSLNRLIDCYDTSLNWDYPPNPGPWREAECHHFNEAVCQALGRLRAELSPAWQIHDEFIALHEDPDLDRYLADPAGFVRI
ncbi:hypothetical protein Q3V23_36170 [Streptomyces sp. VNUA116]|uniref:hypothetical protein n=1 Tax=Streptomyces sp. VNUA116 TaxID=3062449 RepID=UPI0026775383|nr:hypothetical protein [Streptomyces sp. VNUA116]WKU49069.1 hypothetical protein Q3V23_36170 [Streptomyces sp. VNUA116]